MAVRLAESLLERNGFDAQDISERYLDWWREGAFDTGPVAASVLQLVETGLSFEQAAQQVHEDQREMTAGCNPAHRSTPIAMLPSHTNQEIDHFVRREAALTHYHPLAGDVAGAVVVACRELVYGAPWEQAVRMARVGRQTTTLTALAVNEISSLSDGGFAPDALAAAFYFVSSSESFAEALDRSIEFAGPANYCPVLVGSIAGARWGAGSISRSMLEHCQILDRVESTALQLAARWNAPTGANVASQIAEH